MPRKIASYRSYGQKLISLFAKLLFSGEPHSLIELSRQLDCSKQTVSRLIDDIRLAYGVDIEDSIINRRKYYRLKRKIGPSPAMALTESDINLLLMCKTFSEHLIGKTLLEQTAQAIDKVKPEAQVTRSTSSRHFATYIPGTIDYTPFSPIIRTLIQAMEERLVCKVSYKRIMADKVKIFYVKPLKLFSHKDTLYLHGRMARYPGYPYKEPDFNPLLPVHRIHSVELTDKKYRFPVNYDFEKDVNLSFGVMKENSFKVEVDFTGWSARFVKERIWSPDQKIVKKRDGAIKLIFSASSESEIISWALFFGSEAKMMKPKWLTRKLESQVRKIASLYSN